MLQSPVRLNIKRVLFLIPSPPSSFLSDSSVEFWKLKSPPFCQRQSMHPTQRHRRLYKGKKKKNRSLLYFDNQFQTSS